MRDCTSRGQQRQPNQEKTLSFLEKPPKERYFKFTWDHFYNRRLCWSNDNQRHPGTKVPSKGNMGRIQILVRLKMPRWLETWRIYLNHRIGLYQKYNRGSREQFILRHRKSTLFRALKNPDLCLIQFSLWSTCISLDRVTIFSHKKMIYQLNMNFR